MHKPNSKYKLLVLFNESKAADIALNNAINLAQTINGSVDILHIKTPTDATKSSNQLAVMRDMSDIERDSKKEIKQRIASFSNTTNLSIKHHFTFGNVINEVKNYINSIQPDIVVIGKRKPKLINALGDGLTKHLLKNHNIELLISGTETTLATFNDPSIGFIEEITLKNKLSIAENLKNKTNKPFKVFKTVSKAIENTASKTSNSKLQKTIVFEFDDSAKSSSNIPNYIHKNKVNLLCITRNIAQSLKHINTQIVKTEVPILVLAN